MPPLASPAAGLPDAVAVIVGCGIVGLSTIAGAHLAGFARTVAIDRSSARLELAGRLGADVTIDVNHDDAVGRARELTGGRGADHVFEAAGNELAMCTAFELLRPGGELTMLGKLPVDADLSFRLGTLMGNKTIRRLAYGGARPQRDFPAIAQLYPDGRVPLDLLVEHEVALSEIGATFADVEQGPLVRAVVRFPLAARVSSRA